MEGQVVQGENGTNGAVNQLYGSGSSELCLGHLFWVTCLLGTRDISKPGTLPGDRVSKANTPGFVSPDPNGGSGPPMIQINRSERAGTRVTDN